MIKRCLFCGRFFKADPRAKNQKACLREECKKARKQLAQSNWSKNNPNYFKGRYWYVKEWRAKKKNKKTIQKKQITQDKTVRNVSVYKFVLLIPKTLRNKLIKQEQIQFRKIGRTTFFADRCTNSAITTKQDDTRRDTLNKGSSDADLQMTDTFKGKVIQDEIRL